MSAAPKTLHMVERGAQSPLRAAKGKAHLFQLVRGHTADARGAVVCVARLNAAQAAQPSVSRLGREGKVERAARRVCFLCHWSRDDLGLFPVDGRTLRHLAMRFWSACPSFRQYSYSSVERGAKAERGCEKAATEATGRKRRGA